MPADFPHSPKASTPGAKKSRNMKVETSFKPTDKQLFDEENKDFKYTQLILQAKTLQKAVKNIEKHY